MTEEQQHLFGETDNKLDRDVLVVPMSEWDNEIKWNHGDLDNKKMVLLIIRMDNGSIRRRYITPDNIMKLGERTENIRMNGNVVEVLGNLI